MIETEYLANSSAGIDRAAHLLRAAETVALPTETVYGLAADATRSEAVAKVYEAKGRPAFNPLIVHVATVEAAEALVRWTDAATRLANRFWPGPLTLVLPVRPAASLSDLVTAGLETLAVRVPAHPVAQAVLAASGLALAAPSANPSGRITSVTARHVMDGLTGKIAAVLDGGACAVGLESTIVGLSDAPVLLRPGGVPHADLEAALGAAIATRGARAALNAPGQMSSHYAPRAAVRLDATTARAGEVLIGFGEVHGPLTLSERGDLREAATRLFSTLHDADALGQPIAVAPIPEIGLGVAINDRLRRAAAPR